MNILAPLKYQLKTACKALGIFTVCVTTALLLVQIILISSNEIGAGVSAFETNVCVFMGFLGVFTFTEDFQFFIQNGYSRKSMTLSFIAQFAVIAVGASILSELLRLCLNNYSSIFQMIYGTGHSFLVGIAFHAAIYFVTGLISYFIAVLYSRLNKVMRLLVLVVLPLMLFIIVPAADIFLLDGAFTKTVADMLMTALGVSGGFANVQLLNPFIFFVGVSTLLGLLSYAITRRAEMK